MGVLRGAERGAEVVGAGLFSEVEGATLVAGWTIATRPWTIDATWARLDGWEMEVAASKVEWGFDCEKLARWLIESKVKV